MMLRSLTCCLSGDGSVMSFSCRPTAATLSDRNRKQLQTRPAFIVKGCNQAGFFLLSRTKPASRIHLLTPDPTSPGR